MHPFLRAVVAVGGVLCGLAVLFYFIQRRFLYFPTPEEPKNAILDARRSGLEPWLDRDGGLLGWRTPHPSGRASGRLLVFHGNAGSASNRVYLRDAFQAPGLPIALDVYLLEYPGYGPRSGSPSQTALLAAGRQALEVLLHQSSSPVFLLGESLGSAVSALTAADQPQNIAGLILVTPLVNVPTVARRHFPFLPPFFFRDAWRTDRALGVYGGPVAFLIAGRDSVVFTDLGEALYQSYVGPKRLWKEDAAGHNTLSFEPSARTWGEMLAFFLEATSRPKADRSRP